MFWNKKKTKSKPQIKTTVPKTFKAKEPPPKWQPTFGETKKKDEKPPEVTTKSESKIDWENKFLKSFQKLTYNQSDETITTCMLLYGPKADLDGDGYEVEVEDGFVTKGV